MSITAKSLIDQLAIHVKLIQIGGYESVLQAIK